MTGWAWNWQVRWNMAVLKLVHRCTPAQWDRLMELRAQGMTPEDAAQTLGA